MNIWKIIVFISILWYKKIKYEFCSIMLQNSKWRKIVEDLTNIINDDEYFKFLDEIKNDINDEEKLNFHKNNYYKLNIL